MHTQAKYPLSATELVILKAAASILWEVDTKARDLGIAAGIDGAVAETLSWGRLDGGRQHARDSLAGFLSAVEIHDRFYGPQPEHTATAEPDTAEPATASPDAGAGLALVDDEPA
jgi:hypothetical protein